MTTIIVSFASEKEAQEAISRLADANLGSVRARLLDSSEPVSYEKDENNAPMITPNGTMDVRPADSPSVPEARVDNISDEASGVIPSTGQEARGVQVMIEMDETSEETVKQILKQTGGSG